MKILWIAYNPLHIIRAQLDSQAGDGRGGWLDAAADQVTRHGDVQLAYCFPYKQNCEGNAGGIDYYSAPMVPAVRYRDIRRYKKADFERFQYILAKTRPDVIHIWGTETWFQRQFVFMAGELGLLKKTVIWIQGMVFFWGGGSYFSALSLQQIRRKTLWECIRKTNVAGMQKRLALNGRSEIRVLQMACNVFVRTEWDEASCLALNPELHCYHCNETLRKDFYGCRTWDVQNVERYSIFVSQWGAPYKGFHKMLEALAIVVKQFPDAVLYTTGRDVLYREKDPVKSLREPSYEKYIRELIGENHLENNVRFLGMLQAEQMRERYLRSHVFVSASSIENSPNSVGEAMILGVPIVASDVGGVSSLMTHKKEGLLYPFTEYTMLARYICQIFNDDACAKLLSQNARARAMATHDPEKNYRALIESYRAIAENAV